MCDRCASAPALSAGSSALWRGNPAVYGREETPPPPLKVCLTWTIVRMWGVGEVVKRAYKYRFYPSPEQAELLGRTFGCVR
ncbi:helix-turn-helix domain-containing protein, partial [Micromonospora sp. NPDC006766]|uniref:helix-turn-helix domain-containing protein n=1 Tax=Micromonospora sp. NPDC006766 TaxID=3154778 RepID=UPI0033E32641